LERRAGSRDSEATQIASHQGVLERGRPLSAQPPAFVPPPDLDGKEVPKDLRAIIEMALAKDAVRRYDTAGALARDLERFSRGEPVQAKPPGAVARLWR